METNTNTNIDNNNEVTVDESTGTNIMTDEELKADSRVQKMMQSAEDRVRTKYSNDIKSLKSAHESELSALKEELAKLKPVEKTDTELALEAKERELAERERAIRIKEAGIDDSIAQYLTQDCNLDDFSSALKSYIDTQVNEKISTNSFIPTGSSSGSAGTMTKADYHSLSYGEREKLYAENPELVELLR